MYRAATADFSQPRTPVLGGHNLPPLVEIGLTVTQNLGKGRALEALVAVAPLVLVDS